MRKAKKKLKRDTLVTILGTSLTEMVGVENQLILLEIDYTLPPTLRKKLGKVFENLTATMDDAQDILEFYGK